MSGDIIRTVADDFTVRTETLRKYVSQTMVGRETLADPNAAEYVQRTLVEKLHHDIAKAGRAVHGDVTFERHEDFLRDAFVFRAVALTRERTDAHWGEVWKAIHEDEEDRREALRHTAT